jgi:negative regulator of sigma E activity
VNREDHLDRLIEQQLHGASAPLPANDEDAAMLAAAAALARLNATEVPSDLAGRVEASIRAQARAHHNGRITTLDRRPQVAPGARRPLYRRPWAAALAMAAVLALVCVGLGVVASNSLPGDPLYGVKHFEQQIALASAGSPADRARLQITQLQGALADLGTEVNDGRSDDDIQQALNTVATETRDSQSAVASLPAGAERTAIAQSLGDTLRSERATLYQLLARVDWSLRVAFTRQLGVLGAPVPTLARVTVTHGSNNTLTLTLTGTNFVPGTMAVINGEPRGTVSQNTPTQLVAQINGSNWHGGDETVGVLNPDGTAAQIALKSDDQHDGSGGDDHGDHGTPGPTSTPGSGDGHGGDGGSGGSGQQPGG